MDEGPIPRLNAALEGRYRIEHKLGEGGMATVYLARDEKHRRNVALKVLKPELAAVVGAERFLAEIETTANLQHPHILPLFDSGEADGFLFYVMPYVEGESLRGRLDREHQLPVDEAVEIAKNVAEALDYAHRQGVIHRDIKPANILLQAGKPVVSDFGIAIAVGAAGGTRLTETGLNLGTPHYMSPEQATGDLGVGPASDIYSLGCVLYEMLVGEPPYTGRTPQAVLGRIVTGEPRPVREERRSVPAHVEAVIGRALEKVPADRFREGRDFADALAHAGFRHGGRAAAARDGAVGPWKLLSWAFGGAAATLAMALGWAIAGSEAPRPVRRYAVAFPSGQAYRSVSDYAGLALTPDGGHYIYLGGPSPDARRLWLRPRDRLTATPIPGTEGARNPSVSPDGQRFAYVSNSRGRRRLMVAGLEGGPPLALVDSLVGNGGVSWGYDGYIYYDGQLEGDGLARVPEGGGPPESVTTARTNEGERWHSGPHALPNGRGVLFHVRRGGTFDVAVVDLQTGVHHVLVQGAMAPLYSPTGHLLYVDATGVLIAAPFDQDAMALTGDPVAIADGLQVLRGLGGVDVALSHEGTLMYASGGLDDDRWKMVWVTREGIVTEIDSTWAASDVGQPALSPDGRQLAVTVVEGGDSHIWTKQLDNGRLARLTLEGRNSFPAWEPGSDVLAFVSERAGSPMGIYRRPADGSAPATLVHSIGGGSVSELTYTSDGRWLLYRQMDDLFGLQLNESGTVAEGPVELAASSGIDIAPSVSPDGRWLAYFSDESGQYDVYVCPFPSSCDVNRRLVSTGGGFVPVWSHSGEELFYRSLEGQLMAVRVVPGPTFDWGETMALFDASTFRTGAASGRFVVSHDDERFIFVQSADAETGVQLVVVENFFEELRERVPPD